MWRSVRATVYTSNVEMMLEVYFGCPSFMNHKFIFWGGVVTKEMFTHQQDVVWMKRPEMWVPEDWILLYDSARVNQSLLEQQKVTKHKTAVLSHTHPLFDLSLCSFHVCPTEWTFRWLWRLCYRWLSRNVLNNYTNASRSALQLMGDNLKADSSKSFLVVPDLRYGFSLRSFWSYRVIKWNTHTHTYIYVV
jgi:hypothetical protein